MVWDRTASIYYYYLFIYLFIFRATSLKFCYLHVLNFYLDNGVMTTPKRRILSFVFTVLFFIYINDITDDLASVPFIYADDTTLFTSQPYQLVA